jgi:YggT family protein
MSIDQLAWLRYGVLALAGGLALLGMGAMLVQRRTINPFSRTARLIRRLTDPVIKPLERRLTRSGQNPQSAPTWLVGLALVGGIVVMTVAQWLARQLLVMEVARAYGEQTRALVILITLVNWAFALVEISLLVRVIGSWVGFDRYNRWMKPFVFLTEWLLKPLRRIIPPFGGMIDVTPIVAWLLLRFVMRPVVFGLINMLV